MAPLIQKIYSYKGASIGNVNDNIDGPDVQTAQMVHKKEETKKAGCRVEMNSERWKMKQEKCTVYRRTTIEIVIEIEEGRSRSGKGYCVQEGRSIR